MIKVATIASLSGNWKLDGCEKKWKQIKQTSNKDVRLLDAFFTLYPISEILLANADKQIEIIRHIENSKDLKRAISQKKKGKRTHLYKYLKEIFVDHGFDKMNKLKFIQDSGRKVCPYCNRNYIGVLSKKRLYIPLDHFYPKSIYPFLAASVNNLFPCCPTCNSGLKGDKDTFIENVVHPCSIDSDKSIFSFQIKSFSFKNILPPEDSFEIKIENYENNSGIFEWREIFNKYHKDEVVDLIVKKRCFLNPLYIENLENLLNGVQGVNKDDIKRYVLGAYYNPIDHHKKPLSKLIHDIAKQLKIDSN